MTRAVFETATLADSLKKVQRCIPTEGDQNYSGMMLEIRPGSDICVRGTNTELYYSEWVAAIEIDGAAVDWRLPPRFADVIANLPIGSGNTVVLDDSGGLMTVKAGRLTGTLRLMHPSGYPQWPAFDNAQTQPVDALSDRIGQVAWACHEVEQPLSGILVTGSHLVASNRACAARVECTAPAVADPVVAPLKLLGSVIRHTGDVRLGVLPTQVAVCPDEYTQIRVATYGVKYPNVEKALRTAYDNSFTVGKGLLSDTVRRLDSITKSKTASLQIFVAGGELVLMMRGVEREEKFEDSLEVQSGADRTPVVMTFDPKLLVDGLAKSFGDTVTLCYDNSARVPVYMTGGDGYEAWFMQRAAV